MAHGSGRCYLARGKWLVLTDRDGLPRGLAAILCYASRHPQPDGGTAMRLLSLSLIPLALLAVPLGAQPASTQSRLTATDEAAAFRAAGFKRVGRQWQNCEEGSESPSYSAGEVETVRDINGDGRLDAVLIEGGAMCYGMTGQSFWLVSKQADGSWRKITENVGLATFLPRKAVSGWPDIEIGGPGFCFPIWRWNGREYALHRFQYQGKPCRRP